MISINLLPVEQRPRRKTTFPIKSMSLIGGGIVVILILAHILIGIMINKETKRLNVVKAKYEEIKPEYERVKKLKDDKERLEAKMALMDKLLRQRLLWSKKLNQLSDLMPPRVWLSSLSVTSRTDTPSTLVIRCKTYSGKGEKMVGQQGNFMRRLKEHGPFFKDFENVEFISTERETIGQTDIMRFELTCQFKQNGKD